jgi:hypothetical protein
MQILDPVAVARTAPSRDMHVLPALAGRRFGFVTNHWRSMDAMIARMAPRLAALHGVGEVRIYEAPLNGAIANETIEAISRECDAALVGLAN